MHGTLSIYVYKKRILLHGVSKQASLLHTEWHIVIVVVSFCVKVT